MGSGANSSIGDPHGDERLDPAVEAALLQEWEPLALQIARRVTRRFEGIAEPEDMEQVARLGLLQAIRRFDARQDCRFSTFAFPTIVGELYRYLRDRAPVIRIPRRWFELRPRLKAAASALSSALGREPTVEELAQQLKVSEEEVAGALGVREFYRPLSLDVPREGADGEETGPLDMPIGVEDPQLEALELRLALQQLLQMLPERLRDLIRLRFFHGLSQQEVGRRLGISQMHVSRLERQALAKLRQELRRAGEPEAQIRNGATTG